MTGQILTLNKMRNNHPCKNGWEMLLESLGKTEADDTLVTISHLLESNSINDTLWVIYNCIEGEIEKKSKMIHEIAKLAIEPAESVLCIFEKEFPNDDRPRKAIEAAKAYFKKPSADAAADAYAACADAYADAWAVGAATRAAAKAAGVNVETFENQVRQKQKEIILKHFGDI